MSNMRIEHTIPAVTPDFDLLVVSSVAKMPVKCWGSYRRVAVLLVARGARPAMISKRARGVVSVLATAEKLSARGGDGTAYARTLRATIERADAGAYGRAILRAA